MSPPLATDLLALEAWLAASEVFPPSMHPLPVEMDYRLLHKWRRNWPDEDQMGIGKNWA